MKKKKKKKRRTLVENKLESESGTQMVKYYSDKTKNLDFLPSAVESREIFF